VALSGHVVDRAGFGWMVENLGSGAAQGWF
jgi:hypothetical protein